MRGHKCLKQYRLPIKAMLMFNCVPGIHQFQNLDTINQQDLISHQAHRASAHVETLLQQGFISRRTLIRLLTSIESYAKRSRTSDLT